MHFSNAELIAIGALLSCTKCGEAKSPAEFYGRKDSPSGLMSQCKECTKAATKKYRAEHVEEVRAYERNRRQLPHRIAAMNEVDRNRRRKPERMSATEASRQKDRVAHPERYRAREAVSNAVRAGKLTPWPTCAVPECAAKPEAHHPDYGAPLEVVWLCPRHHREAHKMARQFISKITTDKD